MVLNEEYLYPFERMEIEYSVSFGREKKRADIVIFDKLNTRSVYIMVELKKPKLKDGKEQLKSYCNATGAPIGVWSNGDSISFYHRKDPNYFEDLSAIPKATEKLSDILTERWTIEELVKKDKLVTEKKSLKDLILEMEDEVLANAGVDVFEGLFKLIFTKLFDEMESGRSKMRHLEFRNYGETELKEKDISKSHLFTTEEKPVECTNYVQNKVFAIDFDEKAVRVARTLNLIAGDGQTNVLHLNTLDYERWDEKIKDEEWIDTYNNGWKKLRSIRVIKNKNRDFKFDVLMANPPFAGDIKESRILGKYELGEKLNGKYQTKVGRDILFIERNLDFLKPGGRMAVVLPQGRFNNSSDKNIRDFIAEKCRILAVVGLHGNVFKPHTGTKTSVLFVQKWDSKLCPKKEDYPIFFATMQEMSKDNSGEKIFVRKKDYPNSHSLKRTSQSKAVNSPPLEEWQSETDGVVKYRNSKNYFNLPYNSKLKNRAKALRKAGNLSEVLFWKEVRNKQFKGFDFDRQKIIGNYIVDFYCTNCNVVIEIDGSSHDDKQEYDAKRDAYLESLGLTVIHITDIDVKRKLSGVMDMLFNYPTLSGTPPKEGNEPLRPAGIPEKEGNEPPRTAETSLKEGDLAKEPIDHYETTTANLEEYLLDTHGHLIVKHDLFNHDNLTKDGIAEAFTEFAKKEKLSFVGKL